MLDRRTAWLLYDSSRDRDVPGEDAALRPDRTLAYRSGELSLDLLVHVGTGNVVRLRGQVMRGVPGRPVNGASVRLSPQSDPVRTDEDGQFCVSTLERDGPEALVIAAGEREMVCPIPARHRAEAC